MLGQFNESMVKLIEAILIKDVSGDLSPFRSRPS